MDAFAASQASSTGGQLYTQLINQNMDPAEALRKAQAADSSYLGPGAGQETFGKGNWADGLVSALSWGITAYTVVQMVGPMFGLEDHEVDALATASGYGFLIGRATTLATDSTKVGGWVGFFVLLISYSIEYKEIS